MKIKVYTVRSVLLLVIVGGNLNWVNCAGATQTNRLFPWRANGLGLIYLAADIISHLILPQQQQNINLPATPEFPVGDAPFIPEEIPPPPLWVLPILLVLSTTFEDVRSEDARSSSRSSNSISTFNYTRIDFSLQSPLFVIWREKDS